MRNVALKLFLAGLIAALSTGCACRVTKALDDKGGEIPPADANGPLKDINFAFDSYGLDSTAKGLLDWNAGWLKDPAHLNEKVEVQGHCDERGTNEYNMVLGANRAKAGYNYLRTAGVDASRMSTVSFGEELPLDPRHNEEAWAKNRRDHFQVLGSK